MSSVVAVMASFMIFIFIAYRLGYRKLLSVLDHKIDYIRQNLEDAVTNREIEIENLTREQNQTRQIANEIELTLKQAANKISSLHNQTLQELDLVLTKKNYEAKQTINRLRQKQIQILQKEIADLTLETFKMLFETKFSPKAHEKLNEKSIDKIIFQLKNITSL